METAASTTAPEFSVEVLRDSALYGAIAASRRHNYIYVQNWKCGSSTVRSTLWAAEHANGHAFPPGHPHQHSHEWPFRNDPRVWEQAAERFVFTFVRNPFTRILSAYLDKIKLHRHSAVWGAFAALHGLGDGPLGFLDFLRLIAVTPAVRLDPHWRPQTLNLLPNVIPYDFVGRLESLEPDLLSVLGSIFGTSNTGIHTYKRHQTQSTDVLDDYYGPREQDMVRSIYERDFIDLGYGFALRDPSRLAGVPRPGATMAQAWGRAWRLIGERDLAAAERELTRLKPWVAGPVVEEQLLRCRCEARPQPAAQLRECVQAIEPSLAAGYGDWNTWKWYGRGLMLTGRREDGLRAMLTAAQMAPSNGPAEKGWARHLHRRLAFLLASKGRVGDALSVLATKAPQRDGLHRGAFADIRSLMLRSVVRLVAGTARILGAPRWHPDRTLGLPSGDGSMSCEVSTRA